MNPVNRRGTVEWQNRWLTLSSAGRTHRVLLRETGQGVPVLLLHGLAESGRYFNRFIRHAGRSYRFVAVDLPGFGESDKPNVRYPIAVYRAAIDTAWEAGGRPRTVIGHSLGGVLALDVLVRRPGSVDRVAVVSSPFPDGRPFSAKRPALFQESLLDSRPTYLVHQAFSLLRAAALPFAVAAGYPAEVIWDYAKHTPRSYMAYIETVLDKLDIRPALAAITAGQLARRVFLLYGTSDIVARPAAARRYQRHLPGSRLLFVPGGHQPLFHAGISPLRRWLRDQTGARSAAALIT